MPVRAIADVRRLDHVVLHIAADAVLRAEERRQVDTRRVPRKRPPRAQRVRQHRRLIADEADPLAADQIELLVRAKLRCRGVRSLAYSESCDVPTEHQFS